MVSTFRKLTKSEFGESKSKTDSDWPENKFTSSYSGGNYIFLSYQELVAYGT